MNRLKKLLCTSLAVVMAAAYAPAVSAEAVSLFSFTGTENTYWAKVYRTDGYTNMSNNEKSVFGKSSSDSSGLMWSNAADYNKDNGTNQILNNQYQAAQGLDTAAETKYQLFSIEMAVDELNFELAGITTNNMIVKVKSGDAYGDAGTDSLTPTGGTKTANLICIEKNSDGDYDLTSMGYTVLENIEPKLFYGIDVMFDIENQLFSVYVNGVKKLEDESLTANCYPSKAGEDAEWQFAGIGRFRSTLTTSQNSKFYLDGLKVMGADTSEEFNIMPAVGIDENSLKYTASTNIYRDYTSLTADEFKALLAPGANIELSIYDAEYNSARNILPKVCYLKVQRLTDDRTYFYKVISTLFDENFAKYSADSSVYPKELTWTNGRFTMSYVSDVYGKRNGDISFKSLNNASVIGDMTFDMGLAYTDYMTTGKKIVVETNILISDFERSRSMKIIYKSGTRNGNAKFLTFKNDGQIYLGSETAGCMSYELNRWYNVVAAFELGTLNYEVYINGTKLNTEGLSIARNGTVDTVNQVRYSTENANANTSEFLLDDISIYMGAYNADTAKSKLVISNFENNNGVYLRENEKITADEIKANISGATDYAVYADSDFSEILSSGYASDSVPVIEYAENGTTLHRYDIKTKIYMNLTEAKVENNIFTAAGTLQNNSGTEADAVVVAAAYNGKRMVSMKCYPFSQVETEAPFNLSIDTSAETVTDIEIWCINSWGGRKLLSKKHSLSLN